MLISFLNRVDATNVPTFSNVKNIFNTFWDPHRSNNRHVDFRKNALTPLREHDFHKFVDAIFMKHLS